MEESKESKEESTREADNFLIRRLFPGSVGHSFSSRMNEARHEPRSSVKRYVNGPVNVEDWKKGSRFSRSITRCVSTKATQVSYCRSTRIDESASGHCRLRSLTPLTTFYLKFNPKWRPSWQISGIYGITADFTSTMAIPRSSRLLLFKTFVLSFFQATCYRTMCDPHSSLICFTNDRKNWTPCNNSRRWNSPLCVYYRPSRENLMIVKVAACSYAAYSIKFTDEKDFELLTVSIVRAEWCSFARR